MKPITIVGGGLAGLTLGIALREHGAPVTVFEAAHYPRHRVCGEFVSGRGVELLRELRVGEASLASTAAFFNGDRLLGEHRLPSPALCISRFVLDAALADRFRAAGGELVMGTRWTKPTNTEGVVLANGRKRQSSDQGGRWFGLKVHARDVELAADLEMHLGENAYVGLCRLPGGDVNVCGLFRRNERGSASGDSVDRLRGASGSPLFARLQSARFVEDSFCAVAGLSLRPQPVDSRECRVGDALTMIPPITGNGMSMAFESANMATDPLVRYALGEQGWEKCTAEVASAQRGAFSRRLRWAALLHQMLFSSPGSSIVPLLLRAESFWRASFAVTR